MRPRIHPIPAAILLISAAAAAAEPPAPEAEVLDAWVSKTEALVVPAADALPEERYGFLPFAGKFDGVRTFAEQVKHLAATNWLLGSRALGEEPPAGTQGEEAPDSLRTKARIMEYLRGSFACLHRAARTSLLTPIAQAREPAQRNRLGLVIDALVHSANHYGQMAEYLRMNGIVPPASR